MTATLKLDQSKWDLTVDGRRNIAIIEDNEALAQDVATRLRTVLGEQYYDSSLGVAYFDILGKTPSESFFKSRIEREALRVRNVTAARLIIDSLENRKITGRLLFVDNLGNQNTIEF